ncbi:hypothetical protein Dimus_033999 [Dionaea muscipula]
MTCKAQARTLLAAYTPKGFTFEYHIIQEGSNGRTTFPAGISRRWKVVQLATDAETKRHCCNLKMNPGSMLQKEYLYSMRYTLDSKSSVKHRRSLESYLEKLQSETRKLPVSTSVDKEIDGTGSLGKTRQGLSLLDKYLAALSEDASSENNIPSASRTVSNGEIDSTTQDKSDEMRRLKISGIRGKREISNRLKETSISTFHKESFDLYLISFLASVNIAVYLFELASPIKNADYNLYSLPLMYGAKVNHLILIGEWWRLVTPMFLHSGVFHVALSCWVLLSFAPQVCKGYGTFTFFLIYILGGISSNLASFIHTPETTVGGSGPVFAIIGAWFCYQMLNKDLVSKETSEEMFRKAIVATTLSCILSGFGPIDNWADLGAAFTGIMFGLCTCSMPQVHNTSPKAVQEHGIALISRRANPCKSLVMFTVFLLVLSSLLFITEPPLGTVEELVVDLLQISE